MDNAGFAVLVVVPIINSDDPAFIDAIDKGIGGNLVFYESTSSFFSLSPSIQFGQ